MANLPNIKPISFQSLNLLRSILSNPLSKSAIGPPSCFNLSSCLPSHANSFPTPWPKLFANCCTLKNIAPNLSNTSAPYSTLLNPKSLISDFLIFTVPSSAALLAISHAADNLETAVLIPRKL